MKNTLFLQFLLIIICCSSHNCFKIKKKQEKDKHIHRSDNCNKCSTLCGALEHATWRCSAPRRNVKEVCVLYNCFWLPLLLDRELASTHTHRHTETIYDYLALFKSVYIVNYARLASAFAPLCSDGLPGHGIRYFCLLPTHSNVTKAAGSDFFCLCSLCSQHLTHS